MNRILEKVTELERDLALLEDSVEKVDAINQLAFELRNTDPARSASLSQESQQLSRDIDYQNGIASSLTNEAFTLLRTADYDLALDKLYQAQVIFLLLEDEAGIAKVNYNFCLIYIRLSDFNNGLEAIDKSLQYYLEQNNVSEMARCYFQMGNISRSLSDYPSAIEYYTNSVELNKSINELAGKSAAYVGLAHVYLSVKDYEKSDYCLLKSRSLQEKINDWGGYAASLSAKVSLSLEIEDFVEAEKSIEKGIELVRELGIKNGECAFLLNWGKVLLKRNQVELAEKKTFETLEISEKLNLRSITTSAHLLLSEIYQEKNEFEKALHHYKLSVKLNDEDARTTMALKAKSIQFASKIENAQKEAEINRLKNVELKGALDELEEKNQGITASITYALRIQTAILPPLKMIRNHLPDSFVLYKPKDIVAGDFYWMETVGDLVMFATCDCTGHGVPGAMISLVCHNALNRSVREFELTEPAEILEKTTEIVVENFSKSEEEITDGMDISLCVFDPGKNILKWAGANNSLWIVRNGELQETKGDRQSVGVNFLKKSFTNHVISTQKGDAIYIFTDGFTDQFGGDRGKKLRKKNFRELILSMQNRRMEEQGILLNKFIVEYRNENIQVDDILVMGVKI